jgi:hypothetical protein
VECMTQRTRRVTYANVASTLALVLVLGSSGAYAAGLAKDSVRSRQIKNHAVRAVDLQAGSVTGAAVADGSLSAADLAAGTVPAAPTSLPGKIVVQRVDVTLTGGTPGPEASGFIGCLAGQKLIGGSVNVSSATAAEVLISRPSIDNVGTGAVPDDGQTFAFWKGTARATTAGAQTMRVFAFCAAP